jgi:hypothetical protein
MGAAGALQFLLPQIAAATILPALVGAGVSYGTYEFTKPEQNSDSRRLGSIDFTLSENGAAIVTSIFAGVVAAALVSYATLKGLGRLNSFKTKETKAKEVAQEIMNIMPELVDEVIIVLSENSGTQDQGLRVQLNRMAEGLRTVASENTSLWEFVRNIFHAHSGSKVLAGRLINDLLDNQSAIDLLEYFEQDPNSRDIKDSENKELTSSIFFGEESPKSKLIKALTGSTAAQRLDKIIPELKKLADDAAQKKQEAEEKLTTIQKERTEKINNTLPELSVLTERLERLKEEAKATATNLEQLTNQLEDAKILVAACDDEAINLIRLITKLEEEGATEEQIPGQKLELDKKIDLLRKLKRDVNYLETSKQQLEQQAEEKTQEANEAEKILVGAKKEDDLELQALQNALNEFIKLKSLSEAAAKRLERAMSLVDIDIPEFNHGDGLNPKTLTQDVYDCNTVFENSRFEGVSPCRQTRNKANSLDTILAQGSKSPGGDFYTKSEEVEFYALSESTSDSNLVDSGYNRTSVRVGQDTHPLARKLSGDEKSLSGDEKSEEGLKAESQSPREDEGSRRSGSSDDSSAREDEDAEAAEYQLLGEDEVYPRLSEANLAAIPPNPNTNPKRASTDSLKSQSSRNNSQQS